MGTKQLMLSQMNQMFSRFVTRVNPIGGPHPMTQVYNTTRQTHVSPLNRSLRTYAWTQKAWMQDSLLCGAGLSLAIAFVPKWTSLDALAAVGDVSADSADSNLSYLTTCPGASDS